MTREIDLFGDLRRNWVIALVVVALAMLVAVAVTALQQPLYESSAHLIVGPAPMASENDVIRTVESLDRRTIMATFARLAPSDPVLTGAARQLQLSPERAGRYTTRGSVVPNTNIIRITTSGPDPRVAASLANATAALTARQSELLYPIYTLQFMSQAKPELEPVHPDRRRNYVIGLGLALFFGIAAALTAERLRRPPAPGSR